MTARMPRKRFLAALALSFLLHVLLGGPLTLLLRQSAPPTPPVIEARLAALPEAPPPPPRLKPRPTAAPAASHATPEPPPPPQGVPEPSGAAPLSEQSPPPEPPKPAPEPESPPSEGELDRQYAEALPDRFDLRFRVLHGPDESPIGRVTHRWQRIGTHYTLTALAEASGLMSVVYAGLLTQLSEGRITRKGLRPEVFLQQRSAPGSRDKHARFDWAGGRIEFAGGRRSAELREGTQDLLSVVYQLALQLPKVRVILPVTNGRKLYESIVDNFGLAILDMPWGKVPTQHLKASRDDGSVEVWIDAVSRLPVKIVVVDRNLGRGVMLAETRVGMGGAPPPAAVVP
jgi:Protein of unknown function (DUF3108)